MNETLLPINATRVERDLEQLIIQSTDLPVQIKSLWDPDLCPLSLLPWLAWALSVDTWDDRWPEHIKRQVVRDSFEIHRFKGTPYAVQKALDSLNIKTQLREWWEQGGSQKPGTMSVVALINENLTDDNDGLLTEEMLQQVTQAIQVSKRGVIHFDVELGIALDESLGVSGAVGPSVGYLDTEPDTLPVIPDAAGISMGIAGAKGASFGVIDHEANLAGVLPDSLSGSAGFSVGLNRIDWDEQAGDLSPLLPDTIKASPWLANTGWQQSLSDFDFMGTY